jgi:ATP-binding cassette subfamily A (ABC1) protein 3
MDPTARKEAWDIIQSKKKNRVMIMTTHYMDEAEFLGDRIAIMSQGKINCCGSSIWLKNKFGVGFVLEIERLDKNKDMSQLKDYLKEIMPEEHDLEEHEDEGDRMVYSISTKVDTKFKEFFDELDANLKQFNIKEYSFRNTSLEEVFINVGKKEL